MEKVLRSFIHEHFPFELRVQIELIGKRRDISNEEKQSAIIQLLQSNCISNFAKLGPGTNRYAFRLDGFVVKLATDPDGKVDNMTEFKMAKRLFPHVPKTYEISENGSILIAEYIQPYSSFTEMLRDSDKIRKILDEIAAVYFIGDVGISSNNFANWGLRPGYEDPVCLDYAYIYEVNSDIFTCRMCKGDPGMLIPDKDYNILQCTKCNKTKSFSDLRGMIGKEKHLSNLGDLAEEGYKLSESYVLTTLDSERSNYLTLKRSSKRKNRLSIREQVELEIESIENKKIILDDNIKEDTNMSEMSSSIRSIAASIVDDRYRNYGNVVKPSAVVLAEEDATENPDPVKEESETATVVTGKPLNDGNKPVVAFSGKIKNDIEVPVKEDKKPEPDQNDHNEETGTSEPISQSNDNAIHDVTINDFIKFIHPAISKMSNRMAYDIRTLDLFAEIKPYLGNKKILPKAFYDAVQAAIWKTLGPYVGCVEKKDVPNRDNGGTHTEWCLTPEAVEGLSDNSYESLVFIMRLFKNNTIRSVVVEDDVPGNEYIIKYLDEYPNSGIEGINEEWLDLFKERLKSKLAISDQGVNRIEEEFIDRGWVQCFDDEDEPVEEDDTTDEIDYDESEADAEDPYQEIEDQIADELNGMEEISANDTNYVSVDIIHDDSFDTLKLEFNDYNGLCSIPFYTSLDEVTISDEDKLYSPIDPRNSFWDWLRFIAPDIKFYTKDPDRYLEGNKHMYRREEDDTESHYVILAKKGDEYLIGAYLLNGIFIIDDDGEGNYIYDEELYWKINKIIRGSLENSAISFYLKSISDMSTLKTEEYFLGQAEEEEVEVDYQEEEEEDPDEELDNNEENEEDESEVTDEQRMQEEAALAAMMEEPEETKPSRNDDSIIHGYLIEERKNKSVNRTFYYDENHIEKIEGEKGKTYIDITDGSSSNFIYKWNGKNYIPTKVNNDANKDQQPVKESPIKESKQEPVNPKATNNDDIKVVRKAGQSKTEGSSEDEIPVIRRK